MFLHIVGARPNFPKVKPLMEEMKKNGMHQQLLHTGQHYDYLMSKVFFSELEIIEMCESIHKTLKSEL